MTIRTGLYQGTQLRQEMKINPRLYQAMDLLYMPLLDLQQHIKQELLNNPFLDLEEPATTEEDGAEKPNDKEEEQIDWEEILLDGFEAGGRRAEYEEKEYYEPVSVEVRDLADHLRDQLVLLRLSPRQMLLGEEIIGNIDDDGYLTCELEEVLSSLNDWVRTNGQAWTEEGEELELFRMEEAEEMLRTIQGFDPPGIAARNLRECLLLQLQDAGLVLAHAPAARHRLPEVLGVGQAFEAGPQVSGPVELELFEKFATPGVRHVSERRRKIGHLVSYLIHAR
jgi:RNA polymerase sigma-54 factor